MAKKLSKADLERINALKNPQGNGSGAAHSDKEKAVGANQGNRAAQIQHRSQGK